MKKIALVLCIGMAVYACKKEAKTNQETDLSVLSMEEINRTLYDELAETSVYNWVNASNELLWSAGMQSDSIFAVGYQPFGFQDIENRMATVDIKSPQWTEVASKILAIVLEEEQRLNPDITVADLLPFGQPEVLPTFALYLQSPASMERLRNLPEIRYFEPMGYDLPPLNTNITDRSSNGCGGEPDYGLNPGDYTEIAPGAKQSWHHATSNVSSAWSTTTGEGVTVVIIDTGISDDQDNFNTNFNSGWSSGRTVEQISTKYSGRWWWRSLDAPHDQCGHGSEMAGLAAAPRSTDGNAVGIAYNCNLIGIRAVEDVVISSSNERNGVKDALVISGTRDDVKVISMSLGTPFYSGTVADGIHYAYGQGKSIFAAAGTSFEWTAGIGVIFPASMAQTIAVTGIKDTGSESCDVCHDGGAVDFVMRMERTSDAGRKALTISTYSDQPTYVGGSSCATASVAGIAALVYAAHPGASRDEVYDILKENASNYPVKDGDHGWGTIDAFAAVND